MGSGSCSIGVELRYRSRHWRAQPRLLPGKQGWRFAGVRDKARGIFRREGHCPGRLERSGVPKVALATSSREIIDHPVTPWHTEVDLL